MTERWSLRVETAAGALRADGEELLALAEGDFMGALRRELDAMARRVPDDRPRFDASLLGTTASGVRVALATADRPQLRGGDMDAFPHQAELYVAHPDGTVQCLSFGFESEDPLDRRDLAVQVARAVAPTVGAGPATLLRTAGRRRFSPSAPPGHELTVPAGVVASQGEGIDSIWSVLSVLRPLGVDGDEYLSIWEHSCIVLNDDAYDVATS